MKEQKTKPTEVSVEDFLDTVTDEAQRADSLTILAMMKEVTGLEPRMWGPSMIGFGEYHYQYDSGHEGDCFLIGFSPRKGQMSLYFMPGLHRFEAELRKLGKHKTGKACLYIKKLADIDVDVLRDMMKTAFAKMTSRPATPKQDATKKKPTKRRASSSKA